jgi:hypothetical protein
VHCCLTRIRLQLAIYFCPHSRQLDGNTAERQPRFPEPSDHLTETWETVNQDGTKTHFEFELTRSELARKDESVRRRIRRALTEAASNRQGKQENPEFGYSSFSACSHQDSLLKRWPQ